MTNEKEYPTIPYNITADFFEEVIEEYFSADRIYCSCHEIDIEDFVEVIKQNNLSLTHPDNPEIIADAEELAVEARAKVEVGGLLEGIRVDAADLPRIIRDWELRMHVIKEV